VHFHLRSQNLSGPVGNITMGFEQRKQSDDLVHVTFLPPLRDIRSLLRTVEKEKIGGWNDYWYFVEISYASRESGPSCGWVYGALMGEYSAM
jgi:hypothetical protein